MVPQAQELESNLGEKITCASLFPLYLPLTMNELIAKLDWNADPNPSPYQWSAWRSLLSMPAESVLPALREYRENLMAKYKNFFPYNYAFAFERCKSTNKTNL